MKGKEMTIDNDQDVIDSREIMERIDELEPWKVYLRQEEIASFKTEQEARDYVEEEDYIPERIDIAEDDEESYELASLLALQAEAESSPDWKYGEILIRDSYFVTYAEELAEEIGAIDSNASWPLQFIDWDVAADALKMDYESVSFGGVTYWIRA